MCVCGWEQGGCDGGVWGWVCGCVNEVCMEVIGCVDGWGRVDHGCVFGGVGGWMSFRQVA